MRSTTTKIDRPLWQIRHYAIMFRGKGLPSLRNYGPEGYTPVPVAENPHHQIS